MTLFNNSSNNNIDETIYRGDKLKLARMAKGFSLEELASAIGKTRQLINKYEMGMQPTDEALDIICNMLEIERHFLFTARSFPIDPDVCHFRSLRSRTQTLTKSVMANAEVLENIIKVIEEEIIFPNVSIPDASDFCLSSIEDIEKTAEHCRRFWDLGIGPISSMSNLLESNGILVASITDVDDKVDAFSVPHQRPFIIRNRAKKSVCRFRFDLAHELGHLILHAGISTGDAITESQADRFASAFLMPRVSFVKEFPQMKGRYLDWNRLVEFKVRWKVSLKAILYRANSLGIITKEQAKSGFIHLNTKGQTKVERGDELIPEELTNLLSSALEALEYKEWKQMIYKVGVKEKFISSHFELKHPAMSLLQLVG